MASLDQCDHPRERRDQEKGDGSGQQPAYPLTGTNVLEDINGFASVLDLAIAQIGMAMSAA